MNKEQLEGYLLACCDIIDRMIATKQLKEDDVAGKLSGNLREYIRLNAYSGNVTWWHINPYYETYPKKTCPNCGQVVSEYDLHICYVCGTSSSDGTK